MLQQLVIFHQKTVQVKVHTTHGTLSAIGDVSLHFLTDILWSYHHFLAVLTVILWLFWVSRFESCLWSFCSKGSPSSIRFSSPVGSSWWILVLLGLFSPPILSLMSFLQYIHSLSFLPFLKFQPSLWTWVFFNRSSVIPQSSRSFTFGFSGCSLLKTPHRLFQWLYFLLIGWVFSYSVL